MNGKHVIFVSVANMQSDGFHHCVCLRVSSSVSLICCRQARRTVTVPYSSCSTLLPTALAANVMRSVVSVRPSVCFHSIFLNLDFLHMYGSWLARRGLKAKLKRHGQWSVQKCMCYCSVLKILIDGRSTRFPLWRHQLRASAARCAAWRGRGQRQRRSPARVGVVTWLVWSGFSIEGRFYRATLCKRGKCYGPVSVCVCHKSVFLLKWLNVGTS